jgi:multidrug resistance efflux pump
METTAQSPTNSGFRFRVPSLAWVGIALLVVSVVGVGWGLHSPASDGVTPMSPARPSDGAPWRAVCFGHVDVKGGVISLYPLQPGRVVKVEVQDNQEVGAGKPLFRLDDTLAQETVAEAEAGLAAAEAQLKQARVLPQQHAKQLEGQEAVLAAKERELTVARLNRQEARRLVDKKLAREETFQMADEAVKGLEDGLLGEKAKLDGLKTIDPQVGVTRAEQDVKARKASLKKARFGLDECTLKAPCDGTVLRLLVNEGETLGGNPRQPAVYFCPKKARIVRAEVEQEFANRVALHQTASIQDDTRTGPTWTGKVIQVSDWFTHRRSILLEPLQFNDVRTLECIIELDPSTPHLRIGQRVRVILDGSGN